MCERACLLAEKHAPGSSLGPTHIAVLRDQFKRLRDGDRFWYQNRMFAPQEVAALQSTRLSDILQRQNRLTSETSSSRSLNQYPLSTRMAPVAQVGLRPPRGFVCLRKTRLLYVRHCLQISQIGVSTNRAPAQCILCILIE